ncbi:2-hydroxyacid dehydrogenase [Cytobacillus sp. FSL K6-0129]|uniref:2-hydroxyacid dehydrogenase n=1 Tax=Cytobacillus sp. FSL K6-0129 TaxID=2921421 RepID=UPI0030F8825F
MKCLAIADLFITKEMMEQGLKTLIDNGIELAIREWRHESLEALQKDNLAIEQQGSEAVCLPENLYDDIDQYEVIITQFAPIGQKVIEKATNLKLIGVLRGGVENIHINEAKARGVEVINTPGRNARSVAEFTVGMILSEIRNIARSHAALKQGDWRKDFSNADFVPELEDRTIGIIGYGHIGQLVGKFLSGFDTRIIFYDPYFQGETAFEQVDLETILSDSDVVTLHGRLTEETKHLIGYEQLAMMKSTAVLINTARSGLVCEEDLIRALNEKQIAGAAIDTFDHEPLGEASPFLDLDNVTITAHLAGSTIDAFKNTPKKLAKSIVQWKESQKA